jgi:hypothetical protein
VVSVLHVQMGLYYQAVQDIAAGVAGEAVDDITDLRIRVMVMQPDILQRTKNIAMPGRTSRDREKVTAASKAGTCAVMRMLSGTLRPAPSTVTVKELFCSGWKP